MIWEILENVFQTKSFNFLLLHLSLKLGYGILRYMYLMKISRHKKVDLVEEKKKILQHNNIFF